jgi:uncharacterized membrane protein
MQSVERQVVERIETPANTIEPGTTEAVAAVQRRISDGPVELVISWLLRAGVWSSIAIIVAGFVMLIVSDHAALLHRHAGNLQGLLRDGLPDEPKSVQSYGDVIAALRHGQAFGVIMLGLIVLLLTPVLRVAVSIVAFLMERDRLYAAITAAVLLLLVAGVVLGKTAG